MKKPEPPTAEFRSRRFLEVTIADVFWLAGVIAVGFLILGLSRVQP